MEDEADASEALRVRRVGDAVHRPLHRWTPAVHLLLTHLRDKGVTEVPRPVAIGEHEEVLSWLPGDAGAHGWANVVPESGLIAMAELLRRMHDASRGFSLPRSLTWADTTAPRVADVVCHGDFGPWNIAWSDGVPVGVFDWDLAHSGAHLDDIAYALQYVAPFRSDADAIRWLTYPSPPDRVRRMAVFWGAYWRREVSDAPIAELTDAVVARQERTIDLATRLAREGIEPQASWLRDGRTAEWERELQWSRDFRATVIRRS